ncbi:MAG: glycoside hydrolase family 25 protein [Firmicutes bacterium]|nr:glycoside hydrolase family 25 protein [[Eubacterium] siraeum]MCM1488676.1 glycoside hydrolase family 25 protein [Bacillota bacterium]
MKLFRNILKAIAVICIAGCFGFTAVAAMPDGRWDGVSPLRNNRNYIFDGRAVLTDTVTIPPETVLTFREGAELIISKDGMLIIEGGVNLQKNCNIISEGAVRINGSGTLSASGKAYFEKDSTLEVRGAFNIRPGGLAEISSMALFDAGSLVTSEGVFNCTDEGDIIDKGRFYIENDGEMTVGGRVTVTEEGDFVSSGSVTLERKGRIEVYGNAVFHENSLLTSYGKIERRENGAVTDNSTHTDLSVYTSKILKDENEVIKRGIDVSWVQGDIDWEKVSKSGIDFVIIRAARGPIDETGCKEDTHFRQNIEGANRYGVDVGVYFYSYAETVEQAEEEAEFFVSLLDEYEIVYPVIVDLEEDVGASDLSEVAEAFAQIISSKGYFPMIYSYRYRIDDHLNDGIKDKYALWVAQTGTQPETDYDYYIWQYSHEGRINGINGNVDFNIAYRDFPEIFAYYGLNGMEGEIETE